MKFTIDAGHSLITKGKQTPDGMKEWEFNSVVAEYVQNELSKYENVETMRVDDVTGKTDVPLSTRTSKANQWGADVYVSIHANAFGRRGWNNVEGIETFIYDSKPKEAYQLAKLIQENLINNTGRSSRGVKTSRFYVLRKTLMTAILVECGFMTNREEAKLLRSDDYRKKCAKAIVRGLVAMYGLKLEAPDVEKADRFAQGSQEWAMKNGISDGSRPRDTLTRQEMWVMLQRYDERRN